MHSQDAFTLSANAFQAVATTLTWQENGHECEDVWQSERGAPVPKRVAFLILGHRLTAHPLGVVSETIRLWIIS
jgi:hypothetical protein